MLKFQNKKLANKTFNSAVEVPYFTAKCFVNVCGQRKAWHIPSPKNLSR
jgi:hypothetical protein